MEEFVNKRVKGIEISGIRKFYNLVANYKDVLSFTIGQPDFNTPSHIGEAAKRAIDNNLTSYTPNAGLLELRNSISQYVSKKCGLSYSPETEIIVTNGASEAIDIALRTILEEGSEVILPGPVYPGYEPIIKLCGAVPVYIDTTQNNFVINAEMIRPRLTEKTRCIILPYPSNPTGCTLSKDDLVDIAKLLHNKSIYVLSDEIYSELVYDEVHHSIASFLGMKDKTIIVNGLSKSHSMTGWRIGFTLAPSYITKHMLKVHQYNATCACTISQYAAIEALTNGIYDSDEMKNQYKIRRDYMYNRLISMEIPVTKPHGAFYMFPSIKDFNMCSQEFALKLLDEEHVAVIPGDAFSSLGEGYLRLSYACSMDTIKEGLNRLEKFIKKLMS